MLNDMHRATIFDCLDAFIARSLSQMTARLHIEDRVMKAYVRKSVRFVEGARYTALDVGSVDVVESEQRKGHFSRFLAYCEETNPYDLLYVECVLIPTHHCIYERRGFLPRIDPGVGSGLTQDFYKMMKHKRVAA